MDGNLRRYTIVPDRSAIMVRVNTTVGPVVFGATGLEGFVDALVREGEFDFSLTPTAHLELQVSRLTSGNSAYDGELRRQIDVRRFPTAYIDLHRITKLDEAGSRYGLRGEVTFRAVSQVVEGVVTVRFPAQRAMVVTGEETFDIRVFRVPPPTLFMMKIDPYAQVSLQLEARTTANV